MNYTIITPTHPFVLAGLSGNVHWETDNNDLYQVGHMLSNAARKIGPDGDLILFYVNGQKKAVPYANVSEAKKKGFFSSSMSADGSDGEAAPMKIFGMKPWVAFSVGVGIAAVSFGIYKFVTRKKK